MADESTDGAIRPEQFERVKRELDEAQKTVQELSTVVKDFKFLDDAYEHFAAKEGITDPYRMARQAVRDVTLKGVDTEQLGPKLDSWMLDVQSLFGKSGAPPSADEPEVPVVDTAPVPEFGRPNPGADGKPVGSEDRKIDTRSDRFQELVRTGNRTEIERLDKEGLIAWKTQP